MNQGIKVLLSDINQVFLDNRFTKTQKESKRQLLNYLNTNAYRMNYPEYRNRGLLIGSGAIEAAQRTVLQKRLKRSGQRWSQEGVQHMLNLSYRVYTKYEVLKYYEFNLNKILFSSQLET